LSKDSEKENSQIRNNLVNYKNLDPRYLLIELKDQENVFICKICNLIVNDPFDCTYCDYIYCKMCI